MAKNEVELIEVGRRKWPRWMIYHRRLLSYWSAKGWESRRRDGDLWSDREAADLERQIAELFSEGVEDE